MGWHEPPAKETVGDGEARGAQWERARGEGAERDLVGWGKKGNTLMTPTPAVAIILVSDHKLRRIFHFGSV